jgi:anti-sigma B factor antagonist
MHGRRGSETLPLSGRLDASSVGEARASLNRIIDATGTTRGDVVVDLSEVDVIDVTGLGMLAAAHRRLERDGRQLVLRGCADHLRRVLAVTGLSRVMHVEPVLRRVSA